MMSRVAINFCLFRGHYSITTQNNKDTEQVLYLCKTDTDIAV